jgi:hypothetical protein
MTRLRDCDLDLSDVVNAILTNRAVSVEALGLDPDVVPRKHRQRKPREPTLARVAKQASKAGIEVARYEVKPDNTIVVVTGTPERVESDNPWPLDEFRTKETKQ